MFSIRRRRKNTSTENTNVEVHEIISPLLPLLSETVPSLLILLKICCLRFIECN